MGLLDRDHLGPENVMDRVDALERRLTDLERSAVVDLFPNADVTCVLPGGLELALPTEDLALVDAGTAAATEEAWIQVIVNGTAGYIRVFLTG